MVRLALSCYNRKYISCKSPLDCILVVDNEFMELEQHFQFIPMHLSDPADGMNWGCTTVGFSREFIGAKRGTKKIRTPGAMLSDLSLPGTPSKNPVIIYTKIKW